MNVEIDTPPADAPPAETLELEITDVGYGGKGVARHDGCVYFVRGAMLGERIQARVRRRHKSFIEADLVDVLAPSPDRVAPACPLADVCPGCAYQHSTYEAELRTKQAQLGSLLERLGKVSTDGLQPPIASPAELGYRNKITLHASVDSDRTVLGYIGEDNKSVFDVPACPLAAPEINDVLAQWRTSGRSLKGLATGDTITLRHTSADGVQVIKGGKPGKQDRLMEHTVIGDLRVPVRGFFQVNIALADLVLTRVMELFATIEPGRVVDLYCGSGVFALAASQCGVDWSVGVDTSHSAIRAAHRNAVKLGLDGLEFISGPVENALHEVLPAEEMPATTVIVDPPRRGLSKRVIDGLIEAGPANILYVSCAADTLARDVARFAAAGYTLHQAQLFDMFPRTALFETLAWLTKEVF